MRDRGESLHSHLVFSFTENTANEHITAASRSYTWHTGTDTHEVCVWCVCRSHTVTKEEQKKGAGNILDRERESESREGKS